MSKKKETRIPCARSTQNGETIYTAFMTVPMLKQHIDFDHFSVETEGFDPDNNGYQRGGREKEATKYARRLIGEGSFCPNAIWVNDRDLQAVYTPASKRFPDVGYLSIPIDKKVYCPDGQLRVLSSIEAASIDSNFELLFSLPVTFTQLDKGEERRGFIDINDNSKKVTNVLKAAIRWQIATTRGYNALETENECHVALAYGSSKKLDDRFDSALYDMFTYDSKKPYRKRDFKVDANKSNLRKIQLGSFLDSLTKGGCIRFFENHFFQDIEDIEEKTILFYKPLNAFWTEVRKLTQQMWSRPKEYALFDAIGSYALNNLFLHLSRMMYDADEALTAENYRKYLKRVPLLKSHKSWYNANGCNVNDLSEVDAKSTMNDKRGPSYGTGLAKEMFHTIKTSLKRSARRQCVASKQEI